MTALPNTTQFLDFRGPVPNPDWVALPEAAKRLNKNVGHLRRIATSKLIRDGRAKFENGRWLIARAFDPRLDDGDRTRPIDVDALEEFPEHQRRKALMKAQAVGEFRRLRSFGYGNIGDAMPQLLDHLAKQFPDIVGRSGRIAPQTPF